MDKFVVRVLGDFPKRTADLTISDEVISQEAKRIEASTHPDPDCIGAVRHYLAIYRPALDQKLFEKK